MGAVAAPVHTQPSLQATQAPRYDGTLRQPQRNDGYAIHQLIAQCPPLDLNSVYTYLLLSEHFARTSIVAERNGQLDGFISAYRHPDRPDVLFVWQVAVHERARGASLGRHMLSALLARPSAHGIRYLETTVGPDNVASRRMFHSLAEKIGASAHEEALFDASMFGPQGHDDERLIRIGPISTHTNQEDKNDN